MTTDTELTLPTDKMIARISGSIGHVIFNNPERHNAVSLEMWDAVEQALSSFQDDDRVRVLEPRPRRVLLGEVVGRDERDDPG